MEIVREVARQELARRADALLGVVTATHPRVSEDDDSNLEVDVRLKHEGLDLRRVPVGAPHAGLAAPPRVGELVLVQLVGGQINQPVVTSRFYHAGQRPPLAQADELLIEHRATDDTLDHLRFKADGTILLQRDVTRPQDGSEATTTIAIDGASGEIRITSRGKEVTITCSKLVVEGDLEVRNGAHSTTISGNEVRGA